MEFKITETEIDELAESFPLLELMIKHFEKSDEFKLKIVESLDNSAVNTA